MSWTSPARQAAPIAATLPIPEDEAPTAFYRRPRKQTSGAVERGRRAAPSPGPERPTKRQRTDRRAAAAPSPSPSPSPSPPTLLLPTSEARDHTSDGTILSPLAQHTKLPGRGERWSRVHGEWRRFLAGLSSVAAWARTGPTIGLALITSATALAFVGVVAVAYVYISADAPRIAPVPSSGSQEQGLIDHVVDLGRRLRRPTTIPEGHP